ncbi:hypothetical protein D3C81_1627870 [compost metagenome]
MQGRIELCGKRLELALQFITPGAVLEVQVIQFHGQVPACDRQLPLLAQLPLLRQRLAQLRGPVVGQARAVQLLDALVVRGIHIQAEHQLQAVLPGQVQGLRQPAIGPAEGLVAIGCPLHDQGACTLPGTGLPDLPPLRRADLRVAVERLVDDSFIGAGEPGADQQQAHQ